MSSQFISPDHLKKLSMSLIAFLKNPLQEIKNPPDWNWKELLVMQGLTTAASGAVTGLVSKSLLGIFGGVFLTPILTLITLTISSLFFYYIFQILAGKTLDFRRLMILVFFANLPFFLFQMISSLIPPVSLIGLAFTSLLLIVGLVENFKLPRPLVSRVIAALYVVIFMVWIWGRWDSLQVESKFNSQKLDAPEVHLGR